MKKIFENRYIKLVIWVLMIAFTIQIMPANVFADSLNKYSEKYKKQQRLLEKEKAKLPPDIKVLSIKEMVSIKGTGNLRDKRLCNTMPWHRSFRDVNMCTGNLFKSFTDVQVAPAKGAGLVLQRTYNSNDDREGPFGTGWTHAYDIRMVEAGSDNVDKVDFFGGRHTTHRDADGLYTPPPYMHFKMESEYSETLENGFSVDSDTEESLDGTVKHYHLIGNERVCDSIKDRNGNETKLDYSQTTGLLEKVTDPSGRELTFTWDNLGTTQDPHWRIIEVDGPLYKVIYEYYLDDEDAEAGGEAYNLKKVCLDPDDPSDNDEELNRVTTYTYTSYSSELGLLASIADPLADPITGGHTVSYTYGVPSNSVTGTLWVMSINEPAGENTNGTTLTNSWSVDVVGQFPNLTIRVRSINFETYGTDFGVLFDSALRKIGYINSSGNSYPTTYSPDNTNNVISQKQDYFCLNEFDNENSPYRRYKEDVYTYGALGKQLTHTIEGFSGQDTYIYYGESKYFQQHQVTDMNGNVTHYDYGSKDGYVGNRGNLLSVVDAEENETTYEYNSYGQKTSETNANGVVTRYQYDNETGDGNLITVIQDYGENGLNRTTHMVYDGAGRVIQKTDPNGNTSTVQYNVLGQPEVASFPATDDAPAETITYTYGANGRMESVKVNNDTPTTISYEDGCDRVSSVTDPITGSISYTYTRFGLVSTKTLPSGIQWIYTYNSNFIFQKDDPNSISSFLRSTSDTQGHKIDDKSDSQDVYKSYKIDFNQVYVNDERVSYCETIYRSESAGTGDRPYSRFLLAKTTTKYHWLDINNQWQSKLLSQNEYTYDNVGNRLTNDVSVCQPNDSYDDYTETYQYNSLNQLSYVNYGGGHTQNYYFDPMGNRTSKVDTVFGNETYEYNNANMLESRITQNTQSYTNDNNGNTLEGGGRENVWDSQNRLVETTKNNVVTTYTYGADGLRRSMTRGGVTTYYILDGQTVVQEWKDTNDNHTIDTNELVTYFNGQARYKNNSENPEERWYLFDGLGTVLGEVDKDGNVTATRKLDVYGLERSTPVGDAKSDHKFVGSLGHTTDSETGLTYMRARYYDSALGRFISEDPARDGNNWFAYCNNNPVNFVDDTGKYPSIAWDSASIMFIQAIGRSPEFRHEAFGWIGFWEILALQTRNPIRAIQLQRDVANLSDYWIESVVSNTGLTNSPGDRVEAAMQGHNAALEMSMIILFDPDEM